MIRRVALACTLSLFAAPAAAQERWRAVITAAGWTVLEIPGEAACGISRDFGGPFTTTLGLSYDVDGEGVLFVLDRDRTYEERSEFPLTVRLAGSPPSLGARATGIRSEPRSYFRVLFRGEEFVGRFAAASAIAFFRGDARSTARMYDFSLQGSGEAAQRLRECLALVRARGERKEEERRPGPEAAPDPSARAPATPEAAAAAPARRGATQPQSARDRR